MAFVVVMVLPPVEVGDLATARPAIHQYSDSPLRLPLPRQLLCLRDVVTFFPISALGKLSFHNFAELLFPIPLRDASQESNDGKNLL